MKSLRSRALLLSSAAGLSLLLVAAPALADSVVVTDAPGDVIRFQGDLDDPAAPDPVVDPGDQGDLDLRSVQVDHGASDLVVTARFTDLVDDGPELSGDSWTDISLYLDTDGDRLADREAAWTRGGAALFGAVDSTGERVGEVVPCSLGIAEDAQLAETVTLRVPRSCLGTPDRVAVHLDAVWVGEVGNLEDDDLVYLDAAPEYLAEDDDVTLSAPVASGAVLAVPAPAAPQPVAAGLSVAASKKVQRFGRTPAVLTIRTAAGAAGTVTVRDGRRTLSRGPVASNQRLTYRLPKRLTVGVHRLVVTFTPTETSRYTASKQVVKVRVRR